MIHYGDAMLDLFRKSINKNTNLRRCANYELGTNLTMPQIYNV